MVDEPYLEGGQCRDDGARHNADGDCVAVLEAQQPRQSDQPQPSDQAEPFLPYGERGKRSYCQHRNEEANGRLSPCG